MTKETREQIEKLFSTMAAEKHAAGLPLEQAKLIACHQLMHDARAGQIDRAAVADLVIAEEIRHGRSREEAQLHVEAIFAGKPSNSAPRDFGYEKGRVRLKQPRRFMTPGNIAPHASDELSAFANSILSR